MEAATVLIVLSDQGTYHEMVLAPPVGMTPSDAHEAVAAAQRQAQTENPHWEISDVRHILHDAGFAPIPFMLYPVPSKSAATRTLTNPPSNVDAQTAGGKQRGAVIIFVAEDSYHELVCETPVDKDLGRAYRLLDETCKSIWAEKGENWNYQDVQRALEGKGFTVSRVLVAVIEDPA